MENFNWRNIRCFDNSQENAFEELTCQLAKNEFSKEQTEYCRFVRPDGCLECKICFKNGDEYGWQAK